MGKRTCLNHCHLYTVYRWHVQEVFYYVHLHSFYLFDVRVEHNSLQVEGMIYIFFIPWYVGDQNS